MSKHKKTKPVNFGDYASANECTGFFQRIHLDPEEIKTFHKMYNEIDGDRKSTRLNSSHP